MSTELAAIAAAEKAGILKEASATFRRFFQNKMEMEINAAIRKGNTKGDKRRIRKAAFKKFTDENCEVIFMEHPEAIFMDGKPFQTSDNERSYAV